MASYNKVFLMGNLTRDPQVKHLPSRTVVAEFGLAVNRRFKTATGEDKEEVAFVDCCAFGRQAEAIQQYCVKGKPLFIEGRLKFDAWDDKTGGKRSKLTVIVESFQFLGRAGEDGASAPLARFAGHDTPGGGGAPAPKPIAFRAEQQKMFAGETRPSEGGSVNPADRQAASRSRAGVKSASPVSEERQFAEADIPF